MRVILISVTIPRMTPEKRLNTPGLDPEQEEEWLIEVVEQGEGVGRYSSIAYDSTISVPHIAYTAETNEGWAVKHATRPGMAY